MPADTRLFQPVTVGKMRLQHRLTMAPLTRFRADINHVPTDLMVEYYTQRASAPGTLIISEGTFMSPRAGGADNVPGIYNQAQIDAWKHVTKAVHDKGSYIFCQLWNLGRAADPKVAAKEGFKVKSSSAAAMPGSEHTPEAMTLDEIKQTIQDYVQAAKNAMEAGFDGVELHGANGYLIDQFTQDKVNQRTDQYGGSIENRSRFAVEVFEAVSSAIGSEHTAIRFSPYSTFQGMRMDEPVPQFTDVVSKIAKFNPVFIHLVEGRVAGILDVTTANQGLDFAFEAFKGPIMVAGGFLPESARQLVDEVHPDRVILVAFGRYFISTPDLVFRIQKGLALNAYDRNTFYLPGRSKEGYTDYPFSEEFVAAQA
ncbi:FMN-linked oxidoreductase [Coniochaeta ligniaria NRRL 30616]|uniref:FMN-linked oxidoreductase n=1 Tax=Coniochaeta ligniaria NRRL 30616 TaxID=1408157 RepID=A0A1J7JM94_9PEZI|nr:FMN-linked oxidoreductase [Coniochaeta ligniaria NRRL 30616]